MSDSPTSPPSNSPLGFLPAPNAGCWLLLEELLPEAGEGSGDQPEAIGTMLAYARSANGRMRVAIVEHGNRKCALFFGFEFEEEKEEILRLLQSNPLTRRDHSEILTPDAATVRASRPISEVFPADVAFSIRGFADIAAGWVSGRKRVM